MENYGHQEGYTIPKQLRAIIIAIACVIALAVGILVPSHNKMVEKEEDVSLAKSNVETMLQRRLELIPDLVETVKAFTKHEEKVFEDIANARSELARCLENGNISQMSDANSELSRQINQLIAIAENYPELTSGPQYISLMDQLEGSVNRITIARERYNQAVSEYNRTIRKFPNSIYAKILGFETLETFKADEEAMSTNMVKF